MIQSIRLWWLKVRIEAVMTRHLMDTRLFGKGLSSDEKDWVEALAKAMIHVWSATVPHRNELMMIGAVMVHFLKQRGADADKTKKVLDDMLQELRDRGFMQKVVKIYD